MCLFIHLRFMKKQLANCLHETKSQPMQYSLPFTSDYCVLEYAVHCIV